MEKIVVTPRSLSSGGHPLLEKIRDAGYEVVFPSPGAQPGEAQLSPALSDAVGYLAGVEKISAAVLEGAAKLKVISRNGTGVDNIDLGRAKELGIRICRAEGANARGVAELAFGHILSAARRIPSSSAALKEGRWVREKGFELEGKTLALIGCGRIGKTLARFALAFGMKVLAYDPFPDSSFSPSPDFSYTGFDEAVANANVISLHAPPSGDGKALLGAGEFSRMKKGTVIVNTAREGLVDKQALLAAVESGRVSVYTTDAFDREPPDDWELVRHAGVIPTPHIGGFTEESINRATDVAVDNLLKALAETEK